MSKKLLFNFNREVIQNYTYVKYVGTIITATNTLEKPIKSAILSGSTKYRDISSNKIYDSYETATQVWSTNKYKLWCAQDSGTTSALNGTIASGTDIVTLDFHAINHSTYKLTGNCTYKKVVFYDSNQTFISSTRTAGTTNDLVCNNIPSNARYVRFSFFPYADNTGSCSIVDENNNPINLRQIQLISCKMPVLTTIGKNLFNPKLFESKRYLNTNNTPTTDDTYCCYDTPIEAKYGDVFRWSTDVNSYKVFIEFDENGNQVVYSSESMKVRTYTVRNSSTKYIKVQTNNTVSSYLSQNPMLEKEPLTTTISYEPYKSNILSTPEDVELRSLPSGISDTLNLSTGECIQRIDEIVLDGSNDEQWQTDIDKTNLYRFLVPIPNNKYKSGTWHADVVCDKLPSLNNDIENTEGVYINGWSNGKLSVALLKTKLNTGSVAELRDYMSENPITVQYELATPTIKTVDLSILDQNGNKVSSISSFNDTTHITASSETIPPIFEGYLATKEG